MPISQTGKMRKACLGCSAEAGEQLVLEGRGAGILTVSLAIAKVSPAQASNHLSA